MPWVLFLQVVLLIILLAICLRGVISGIWKDVILQRELVKYLGKKDAEKIYAGSSS